MATPGRRTPRPRIMWVFLAVSGLDLPRWAFWLVLTAYVTLLGVAGRDLQPPDPDAAAPLAPQLAVVRHLLRGHGGDRS